MGRVCAPHEFWAWIGPKWLTILVLHDLYHDSLESHYAWRFRVWLIRCVRSISCRKASVFSLRDSAWVVGLVAGHWWVVSTETRLIVETKHTNVAVYCSTDWQEQISRRYMSRSRPASLWINNGFNVSLPGLGRRLVHVSVARLTRQRLPCSLLARRPVSRIISILGIHELYSSSSLFLKQFNVRLMKITAVHERYATSTMAYSTV